MEILVKTFRGDLLDTFATGHIAVTDSEGRLLYSAGNPEHMAYSRSSIKLVQAMVPVEDGAVDAFNFTQQELAQICASHNGEKLHYETVMNLLNKIGLSEEYLQCGTHFPLGAAAANEMKAKGEIPTPAYNNCSGKHTGMLASVKHLGEDLDTYYKIGHPHQERILEMIAYVCGAKKEDIVVGLDGCGVPVHAMPVRNFAYGTARMTRPETLGEKRGAIAKRVTDAVMAYPENVSGSDKLEKKLMEKYPGKIFIKRGAAGYCIAGLVEEGLGIALKVDDGQEATQTMVILEVLCQLGFIKKEDEEYFKAHLTPTVYNHKKELAGHSKCDFKLKKHF